MKLFFENDSKTISKMRLLGKLNNDDYDTLKKATATITDNLIIVPVFRYNRELYQKINSLDIVDKVINLSLFNKFVKDSTLAEDICGCWKKLVIDRDIYFLCVKDNELKGVVAFNRVVCDLYFNESNRLKLLSSQKIDDTFEIYLPEELFNISKESSKKCVQI